MTSVTTIRQQRQHQKIGATTSARRVAIHRRSAYAAVTWSLLFAAVHAYWAVGGTGGLEGERVTGGLLVIDAIAIPLCLLAALIAVAAVRPALWPVGDRMLRAGAWTVAVMLGLRGLLGLGQTALGQAGDVPWGVAAADPFFLLGGLLFGVLALDLSGVALAPRLRGGSLAWTAYAASAWAIAYAVGVRGYQGLGGTLGLPGTFEDPAAVRRASLLAGVGILLVGVGALALDRPWGLRLPRWLVIVPALTGSAYAVAHALTAYVTKPLHALGVVELEFRGWARLDEAALIRWDLAFYEPWFLGLGVLVTLATLHHYRRTGGSRRGARRLVTVTTAAALALTAFAVVQVVG